MLATDQVRDAALAANVIASIETGQCGRMTVAFMQGDLAKSLPAQRYVIEINGISKAGVSNLRQSTEGGIEA
jgi:hypothetical protein